MTTGAGPTGDGPTVDTPPAEAPTAKDKVAAMLKERVAPALREMGFKRSINLLACSHADWAALVAKTPRYGPKPILSAQSDEVIGVLREYGVPALRAHLPVD